MLVKKMSVIKKTLPFGREKLILAPKKDGTQQLCRLKVNEKILTFFLTIKTLKSGDYFGVGEPMKDSFIVTKEKVLFWEAIFIGNHVVAILTVRTMFENFAKIARATGPVLLILS